MPLTDLAIRNAKPREKPYKLGDMLGLFLLVQPSGGKLWRLKYRFDGREKKIGFGTYEPHRVCRRLQLLRKWSRYEQDDEQICP